MIPELPGAALADHPSQLIALLVLLAFLPAALVMLTSFLKMAVVLSIARSALGAPQVPPTTAVTGLALVLTLVVMGPVVRRSADLLRAEAAPADVGASLGALERASSPGREFLSRFARPDDRATFLEVGRRLAPPGTAGPSENDLAVLAPAFAVSELRRAFTIGFLVFLPFLVVDLVVANVLLALGLTQLSPSSVSLPLKLLLFVGVDGWRLLARGLALSYAG
jgi:type III secretion protein R